MSEDEKGIEGLNCCPECSGDWSGAGLIHTDQRTYICAHCGAEFKNMNAILRAQNAVRLVDRYRIDAEKGRKKPASAGISPAKCRQTIERPAEKEQLDFVFAEIICSKCGRRRTNLNETMRDINNSGPYGWKVIAGQFYCPVCINKSHTFKK